MCAVVKMLRRYVHMAELDPGHPDELRKLLTSWLNQANDPIGNLPPGVAPVEWAVQQFVESWRRPVRGGIDSIEASLKKALDALRAGKADDEIECSLQTLAEDVRDELGLSEWNGNGT